MFLLAMELKTLGNREMNLMGIVPVNVTYETPWQPKAACGEKALFFSFPYNGSSKQGGEDLPQSRNLEATGECPLLA